ncbi:MAG: SPOR domain-containing protein [Rhodocyclaceae bacterium]|nr:SPOR domain-containing protein [Rhodocyclaceae bacterium]
MSPPLTLALRERIEETRQWLDRADDDRWFVQLTTGSAGEMAGVGDYLARTDQLLQTGRAGLYLAETAASTRIGVIYGDFPSRKAANQAIDQLPDELKLQRPFARKVAWLKQGRT